MAGEKERGMEGREVMEKESRKRVRLGDKPCQCKSSQFLQVKGEVGPERCLEKSSNRLFILDPDSCQTEEKGTADRTKEPSPVVTDSKVC